MEYIDNEHSISSPDISETGEETTLNPLTQRSKVRYQQEYNQFCEWCKEKNLSDFSEDSVLAYFTEIAKTKKSSSLWAVYSMLKCTINLYKSIDIGKYGKLIAFLKIQAVGFVPKKAAVFTRSDVDRFLTEAPDKQYLLMKIALIFGIEGACRRDELTNMTIDNIQDTGSILVIRVPNNDTKTERRFMVTDSFLANFYRKYLSLRPPNLKTRRLFMRYTNGKCTSQVVGMNTFGAMPCCIAKYLKLPDPNLYTGHSFRRTSAALRIHTGGDIINLKQYKTLKSSTVGQLIENKISNKETPSDEQNVTSIESKSPEFVEDSATTSEMNFEETKVKEEDLFDFQSNENNATDSGINFEDEQEDEEILEEDTMNFDVPTSSGTSKTGQNGITIQNCQHFTINFNIVHNHKS